MKEEVSRRAGLTSVVRRGGWEMAGLPKLDSISDEIFVSISRITLEVLTKDTNPDIVVIFIFPGSVGIQCP